MSLTMNTRTTTLVDEVAFAIEKAILDGEYPPGAELPQEQLCARLGVSRTPVREALRRLDTQGLVVQRPNRGAVVRQMTRDEVADLYHVRAHLEGWACELACARTTAGVLADLEDAQGMLESASKGLLAILGGPAEADREARLHERLREANDRFHKTIFAASGSDVLSRLILQTWNTFPKDYVWRTLAREEDSLALNTTQHRDVMAALETGDATAAGEAMRRHVELSGRLILDHLDRQAFWGAEVPAQRPESTRSSSS